jgi:hypothetical protein
MDSSNTLSIIALVLSVASTVVATLVAYRASNHGITVTTYNNATELTLQVDRVFVEYPELRPYFYDNEPLTDSAPHRNRVLAVTELYLDVLECIWDREREFSPTDRLAWRGWIVHAFDNALVLREFYRDRRDWYPTLGRLLAEVGR